MTRSMAPLAPLTVEASRTLSQIARDALDEEQYDMMVDSLDQLVTLGFHPPPDLIRALFAVVLCDPSDVESSTGGRVKRKKQRRYLGLQYSEQSGPASATIADAASLLEKLGSVAGPSVFFDALPPKCAGIEDEEKRLRESYQTLSGRRASTSPAAKRRRKSGRGIRHMDDGSDNDDDDDSSRGSDSDAGASSEFARRVGQMVQSQQIWDVLLYDPFHVNEAPPKKAISHREADEDGDSGPQDHSVVSANADRESVWRALSILVRLWDRQRLHLENDATLNLSSQVCPPEETDKGRHAKRRKRDESPGPSPQLSKVLEIVRIGMTTPLASKSSDTDWEVIIRQRFRHKKGQVAVRLLATLFDLAEKEALPPGTLVKGVTRSVFLHVDCLAMQSFFRAVMPSMTNTWNLSLAALYYLCESGLEKNDDYDDDPPEEYTAKCNATLKDETVDAGVHRIVDEVQDAGWLVAGPDFDVLEHESLLATIPSNVKRQAGELLMKGAWQLSSQSDNIAVESITTRAGKAKAKRDKDEASQARLDVQALALALRIKADEINMICSRSFARIEVVKLLLQKGPDGEDPAASVATFAKTCITAINRVVVSDRKTLEQCVESMSREVTRVEGDIDLFVKGNEGTSPTPGAYASDDSSGKKVEETGKHAAQCHHHFERVTAALRVLCECESSLGSLSQEASTAAIGASKTSPIKPVKHESPAKAEASISAAAGTTMPSPKKQYKTTSPAKIHGAKSAVPTPSPEKKAKRESPAKVPRVAFQAPSSPAADALEEQPEAAFPSLSQSSAKSIETIVLSSDTDDDDIVRVRRQRRPRRLS